MTEFLSGLGMDWLIAHQQLLLGVAGTMLLTQPGGCAQVFFSLVIKIPGVGWWIGTHPTEAKAWADKFDAKIDALIDKYAASASTEVTVTPAVESPKSS